MHTLHEKRGKKTVTHYFHHVTEKDGSKKHVYLGTDEEKAKDRLTKLRVARLRSENKLVKELEDVQLKLYKLGEYNKEYEELSNDLNMSYYRQKHAEKLLGNAAKPFPTGRYIMIFGSIMVLTACFYYLFSDPVITGAAIRGVSEATDNNVVKSCLFLGISVLVLAGVFHLSDYALRHKHDRYRPPE